MYIDSVVLSELFNMALLGVGGGLLLSGLVWLIGLAYSLGINLIKSFGKG